MERVIFRGVHPNLYLPNTLADKIGQHFWLEIETNREYAHLIDPYTGRKHYILLSGCILDKMDPEIPSNLFEID